MMSPLGWKRGTSTSRCWYTIHRPTRPRCLLTSVLSVTLVYVSPPVAGSATISASKLAPWPTKPFAGTANTTTYGWSALHSLRPSHKHSLQPTNNQLQSGPITTLKTVPPTLFVPLATHLLLLDPPCAQRPILQAYPLPQANHCCSNHPLLVPTASTSHIPAATLTKLSASSVCANSAPLLGAESMGRGTAPLSVDQHQLVTPMQLLQLERKLDFHPDKVFVCQLLDNIRHGCCIGYDGPHFKHTAKHLPTAYTHAEIITKAKRMSGRPHGWPIHTTNPSEPPLLRPGSCPQKGWGLASYLPPLCTT